MNTPAYIFGSLLLIMLCLAGCKTKQAACVEQPCTTACNRMYKPVCGCNNKTYSNACVAECHGIKEYKEGPCEGDE